MQLQKGNERVTMNVLAKYITSTFTKTEEQGRWWVCAPGISQDHSRSILQPCLRQTCCGSLSTSLVFLSRRFLSDCTIGRSFIWRKRNCVIMFKMWNSDAYCCRYKLNTGHWGLGVSWIWRPLWEFSFVYCKRKERITTCNVLVSSALTKEWDRRRWIGTPPSTSRGYFWSFPTKLVDLVMIQSDEN